MAMMVSAPIGGSDVNFEDMIGLLKDEPGYQAKLRDMQKRTEQAIASEKQAVETLRKVEEVKKLTTKMAAQVEQQLMEANQVKEAADQQVATAAKHEKELATQHEAWQQQADAELSRGQAVLRDAFTTREKEVAAKEQKLLASIQDYEDKLTEYVTRLEEFTAFQKHTEGELSKREASVREGEARLIANLEEVQATKAALKEKLKKIREISGA